MNSVYVGNTARSEENWIRHFMFTAKQQKVAPDSAKKARWIVQFANFLLSSSKDPIFETNR